MHLTFLIGPELKENPKTCYFKIPEYLMRLHPVIKKPFKPKNKKTHLGPNEGKHVSWRWTEVM